MLKYNINSTTFVTTGNKEGLSNSNTTFHYFQKGNLITGNYSGGDIIQGQIVGKVIGENKIQLLFQCLTKENELLSGQSIGKIDLNKNDLLTLCFDWSWLNGNQSGGISNYVQIK